MTEARREQVAKRFIEMQGREVYFPRFHEIFSNTIQPLFPRYLFVHTTDGVWSFLKTTFGIFRVLVCDQQAELMSDKIVSALRKRERNGLVNVNEVFCLGEKVTVIGNGLFSGWKGTFAGMKTQDRCKVMLNMLGQEVPIDMEVKFLRATA